MIIPSSFEESISESILSLELIPDASRNFQEDPAKLNFSWTVIKYTERNMEIKVTFDEHEYISAGANRDILQATILE